VIMCVIRHREWILGHQGTAGAVADSFRVLQGPSRGIHHLHESGSSDLVPSVYSWIGRASRSREPFREARPHGGWLMRVTTAVARARDSEVSNAVPPTD